MKKSTSMISKKGKRGKESSSSTVKSVRTSKSEHVKKYGMIEDVLANLEDTLERVEYLRISDDNISTTDVLSIYEKTNLIAVRAKQIEQTGETYIDPAEYGFTRAEEIAEKELELGKCPYLICRKISNRNIIEYLNPNEMIR